MEADGPPAAGGPGGRGGMPGLRRGLKILEVLAATPAGLTFSGLRDSFPGLAPSTLSRLLRVLAEEGMVTSPPGSRRYLPGERAHALGRLLAGTLGVAERLGPCLRRLAQATGFSAVFFEIQGREIVLAAKHELPEAFHYSPVGSRARYPAEHACAKVCLAHLPRRHRNHHLANPGRPLPRGRAEVEEELRALRDAEVLVNHPDDQPGLTRVAAPVFGDGACVGAIGVSFFRRLSARELEKVAAEVRDAARRAGDALEPGWP